jgi:hypothetical protein
LTDRLASQFLSVLVQSHIFANLACYLIHVHILFGLLFSPEEEGNMFLKKCKLTFKRLLTTPAVRTSNPMTWNLLTHKGCDWSRYSE